MTPIRLLLADDHNLFRQGLAQICIQKGGFEVVGEAADGATAVRLAAELQPDVILIDINMPKLNGIQATTQIMAANPQARIIVLTMYRQEEYIFEAIKAGAKGYLLKNADAAELVAGVRQVYEGHALLDAHLASRVMQEFRRLAQRVEPADDPTRLSASEMEILRLITEGLDNKGIAEKLNLSPQTVANRVRLIYPKLGVSNRTQAALYAVRQGWVKLDEIGE